MNAKKFSDAMSELDTKYVDEALNYKKKSRKPVWVKWGAMAACLCLIVAAIITVPSMLNPQEIDSGEAGGLAGGNENVSENILQFPDTIKTIEVTYLVYSSEISRELSQDEIVAIKEWATALELEHMSYGEGEAPNEVYAGGESWVFDVNNGEIKFTYSIIDNHYIFYNDEWYLVKIHPHPPLGQIKNGTTNFEGSRAIDCPFPCQRAERSDQS